MTAYRIVRITNHPTVEFAVTELKKYLRMMMPRAGEIPVGYASPEDIGAEQEEQSVVFRVGLLSDLGLRPVKVEDEALDDVLYAETGEKGGIIAGNNPRAVLLSVYRYLRENGCRWLFPGPDGERIPIRAVQPVSYCEAAAYRYRGQCNEGSETQQILFDAIDFTPKIGLNTFMQEFDTPRAYYDLWFRHGKHSCLGLEPETVSDETILQWKRACEAEITKRGLLYHDMGHGWTADPFGIPSLGRWDTVDEADVLPEGSRQYLALLNGRRGLYHGVPLNTNVCLSNPEVRRIMANAIADYAEQAANVDFLHIWLADGSNNHCECEECRKKKISDWYVMMLNEADAELTRRGLGTHLVFIVYVDTVWAPDEERLQNPGRFSLLFAPITRRYTETYEAEPDPAAITKYEKNKLSFPQGMAAYLGYLGEWKKQFSGDAFCYEYHFWVHQYHDPGGLYHAKTLYRDICALRGRGLSGMVEDGSQRSGFPTGFSFYLYGRTLFDPSLSFEEIEEEYFSAAFGEDWRTAVEYLNAVSDERLVKLFYGEKNGMDDAAVRALLADLRRTAGEFRPAAAEHRSDPVRVCAVSWDLLARHAGWCIALADAAEKKLSGDADGAREVISRTEAEMAILDFLRPGNYDHALACRTFEQMIDSI